MFFSAAHNTWSGFITMLVAGIVSITLFAAQACYTGPVPLRVPQLGDLTFLVGFVLAALLYGAMRGFRRGSNPA